MGAAAVVNGGLAHTLDYDDAVDASGIHATASAFPAALACCEYKGATGKELVEAVVAGADMVCRLGLTSPKSIAEMGWLGPSLCQPKEARYTPQVSSDARFSIPFTVANALVHGNVTLANFTEEGMHDEAVLKMAEKIEWYPDDELMAESKGVESAKVTITLNDRKEHYIKVEEPLGGVVNPMTEQDLINKFRDCCSHARKPMTEEQVNQLIDMCLNLEKLNDVRDLVALIS